MNKKAKTSVIASSALAIALSASIGVGATYALFTSESTTNIAVTSGKVSVKAEMSDLTLYSPTEIACDGSIKDDTNAATTTFANSGTATLNGNELTLTNVTPGDKAEFTLTVKNYSTVSVKYRTQMVASADNGLFDGLTFNVAGQTSAAISEWQTLAAATDSENGSTLATYQCSVQLPTTAGSEYQGASCTIAYSVEAVQGNSETKNDTAYYTLSQFNDLTEIDEEIETVYLSLGKQTVAYGEKLTIGNSSIGDTFALLAKDGGVTLTEGNKKTYTTKEEAAADEIPEGYRVHYIRSGGVDSYYTILETAKHGFKLVVSGSITVTGMPDSVTELNVNGSNGADIAFAVPGDCTIVADGLTINGVAKIFTKRSSSFISGVFSHKVPELIMQNCNLNMCWIYDGMTVEKVTFTNCTFNTMEYKDVRNSNPIWWRPTTTLDVAFNGCTFLSILPVKFETPSAENVAISFTNCKFDIAKSAIYSKDTRNFGILFVTQNAENKYSDVVLTGNVLLNETAGLVSFYNANVAWKDGCYLTFNGNMLNGTKLVQMYKAAAEITGDFINGTDKA